MLKFNRSLFKVRYYNSWQELASQTRSPSNKEVHLKIASMQSSILELRKDLDKLKYKKEIKQYKYTETGTIEDIIEDYWKIGR